MSAPTPPRLALRGISKRYGELLANDAIDLDVAQGEIHAVLGENGAGKSTLMKVVAGEVLADDGEVAIDGVHVELHNPQQARAHGIAMVHQHPALFESLTVAENVALGLRRTTSLSQVRMQLVDMGRRYHLEVDPAARVHDLGMGERQRVEILRALLAGPRLLILDEPTSVLTPQAVRGLFSTLRALAATGLGVLFVSHKLEEIRALAQRCTILRGGRVVARVDPRATTQRRAGATDGRPRAAALASHDSPPGKPRLQVNGLRLAPGRAPVLLDVASGEIVGIAGISGNGQRALAEALSGERLSAADAIRLDGAPIGALDPRARRALGLRYVPGRAAWTRCGHAWSLADNAFLTIDALRPRGWLRPMAARRWCRQVIERFDVRPADPDMAAGRLSGGNLQKYIVGRELHAEPRALVIDQPTWGVDVGAAATIHNELLALRARGCAILLISEELDELFALCDRIAVCAAPRTRCGGARAGTQCRGGRPTHGRSGNARGGMSRRVAISAEPTSVRWPRGSHLRLRC